MPRGGMTKQHKEALAKGRRQGKIVRDYLAALNRGRKPGRPVDRTSLTKKIERIQSKIDQEMNPARQVELVQERLDTEERLAEMEEAPDLDSLERDFVEVAKDYSERKGITYTAWREIGVPASILRDAGIPRTRRTSAA